MGRTQRILSAGILVLWLLAGPIGMAFDQCASIGAMCEGPSGLLTGAVTAVPDLRAPTQLALIDPAALPFVPSRALGAADPPPKLLSV